MPPREEPRLASDAQVFESFDARMAERLIAANDAVTDKQGA